MDCIKSFSFVSSANQNFTTAASEIYTWSVGAQHFWTLDKTYFSTFNIQGYKNVNIVGMEIVGNMQSLLLANSAIVNDWRVILKLNGQIPVIGGNITVSPNNFSLTTGEPQIQTFNLSKYNPKINFASPVQSVTSIELSQLSAQGIGAESLTNINLGWGFTFIFYYKFEGE